MEEERKGRFGERIMIGVSAIASGGNIIAGIREPVRAINMPSVG